MRSASSERDVSYQDHATLSGISQEGMNTLTVYNEKLIYKYHQ